MFDPISMGVSLIGGLLGSKNKGTTTTDKKEPWAPAQQYLIDNLATNKQLQDYYQQNPFNAQQQQGYQNLFSDADNFRGNVAPGLLDFANGMMGSNYKRTAPERPGQGAGYLTSNESNQGPVQPTRPQTQNTNAPSGGLLAPLSVAPSTPYGRVDFQKQNPFYKTPEQQAAAVAEQERLRLLAQQQQQQPAQGLDWYQNQMTGLGA